VADRAVLSITQLVARLAAAVARGPLLSLQQIRWAPLCQSSSVSAVPVVLVAREAHRATWAFLAVLEAIRHLVRLLQLSAVAVAVLRLPLPAVAVQDRVQLVQQELDWPPMVAVPADKRQMHPGDRERTLH
jgi:hypothetical protein